MVFLLFSICFLLLPHTLIAWDGYQNTLNYVNIVGSALIESGSSIESWVKSSDGNSIAELVMYLPMGHPYQCWLQVVSTTNQSDESTTSPCMVPTGNCTVKWKSVCIIPAINCTAMLTSSGDLELLADVSVEWSSGTADLGASSVAVSNKGELVLLNARNSIVWSSNDVSSSPDCSYDDSLNAKSSGRLTHSPASPLLLAGIAILASPWIPSKLFVVFCAFLMASGLLSNFV